MNFLLTTTIYTYNILYISSTYRHSERTKTLVHDSMSSKTKHELHEPRKLIKNAYQRDKKIKSKRGVVFFCGLGTILTSAQRNTMLIKF